MEKEKGKRKKEKGKGKRGMRWTFYFNNNYSKAGLADFQELAYLIHSSYAFNCDPVVSINMPATAQSLLMTLASPKTVIVIILVICLLFLALNCTRHGRKRSHRGQGPPVVPSRLPFGQFGSRRRPLQDEF